jgi:hypothetical protein
MKIDREGAALDGAVDRIFNRVADPVDNRDAVHLSPASLSARNSATEGDRVERAEDVGPIGRALPGATPRTLRVRCGSSRRSLIASQFDRSVSANGTRLDSRVQIPGVPSTAAGPSPT